MNQQHDIERYWQDEDDWLCTVEFLPGNAPEDRALAADIVGYLFGYAQLTNARALALVGDPAVPGNRPPESVHRIIGVCPALNACKQSLDTRAIPANVVLIPKCNTRVLVLHQKRDEVFRAGKNKNIRFTASS
jgi:hypothetical protein